MVLGEVELVRSEEHSNGVSMSVTVTKTQVTCKVIGT